MFEAVHIIFQLTKALEAKDPAMMVLLRICTCINSNDTVKSEVVASQLAEACRIYCSPIPG